MKMRLTNLMGFKKEEMDMGTETIYDKLKTKIGGISFKIFLWSWGITREQYWEQIQEQEIEEYEDN